MPSMRLHSKLANSKDNHLNFDPKSFDLDFRPPIMDGPPAVLLNVIAEESVIEAIAGKTDSGLRIVRHLMDKYGMHSMPDFTDGETVRFLARRFVQDAGSGRRAIELLNELQQDGITSP